jgi:hypothetical protein
MKDRRQCDPLHWVYDEECYPNIFTASFKHPCTGTRMLFEVSEWKTEINGLLGFLAALQESRCLLVGFNNVGYDYPILHFIMENAHLRPTYNDIYNKSASIIATPWERRFDNVVFDSDVLIPQIDLYKIHHFDNDARRTSLKMLEFNMRSGTIEDLPFTPGYPLTFEQRGKLIAYNDHDVDETEKFYLHSTDLIEFREKLSTKYGRNFLNHNDTKIGKDYFIMQLERLIPGSCYTRTPGAGRKPRQTIRASIAIKDVIFPYIQLIPEFERVRQWLAAQTITETKGVFNDLSATVDGFTYDFGAGGIHGSIDPCVIESDDDYVLYDWDVASYYPNLAIVNRLYPEHLSEQFCDIYKDVFKQRRQYKKGTPENAMLKLALNGVYGDSNNKYSPFYDPQYTMSITINGQLLLCMLAQHLISIPNLSMVQINTDGLTVRVPRGSVNLMIEICEWWQNYTWLELEHVIYKRMFIRDVNNYIGEYEDGKLKRKGAYAHQTPIEDPNTQEVLWHKNHSALVIPKAAEAALVRGESIREFITGHADIFDFMLRTKVNRKDQLMLNDTVQLQNITRYYIAYRGGSLTKVSPPANGARVGDFKRANGLTNGLYQAVRAELREQHPGAAVLPWDERINTKNRSKYAERRTGLNVGWLVAPCNDISGADRHNINFEYYIAEAEKLVAPLRG